MDSLSPYLLDTTVALVCVRGGRLADYIDTSYKIRSQASRPLISIVSIGELYALGMKREWGKKKLEAIDQLIRELVVVDINRASILRAYAEIDFAMQRAGKVLGKNDIWIAATAKATSTTLLTTDKDFDPLHQAHLTRIWIDPAHGKPA